MRVGGGNKGLKGLSEYSMRNQKLEFCDMGRHMGVIMSADLKVGPHFNQGKQNVGSHPEIIYYKVTRSLTQLIQDNCSSASQILLVRLVTTCQKDENLIEKVQHRFTRMIPSLRSWHYEDRLKQLGLWTLEVRRNHADLIEVFKIAHGFSLSLIHI